MNRKTLSLSIATIVVAISGVAIGAHYVISGTIEENIAMLEARSPGTTIDYGSYYIDPMGMELVLNDVTIRQEDEALSEPAFFTADRVVYRNCDLKNLVPRYCAGGMMGGRISSEDPTVSKLLQNLELLLGEELVFDAHFEQSYDPKSGRLSSAVSSSIGQSSSIDFSITALGVDWEKLATRASEISKELKMHQQSTKNIEGRLDPKVEEELVELYSKIQIEHLSHGLSSETLLSRAMAILGTGTKVITQNGVDTSAIDQSPYLDGAKRRQAVEALARSPLLSAQTGQPAPANDLFQFLASDTVLDFIESPQSMRLTLSPEEPFYLAQVLTGNFSVEALGLSVTANGDELPVAALAKAL